MDVIAEVKKLSLPTGEYLVVGSGIMHALGMRESEDIDLLVTPRAFDELRARGWEYRVVEIGGRRRGKLSFGIAEAYADLWYGDARQDAGAAIANAEVIDGIPFQPLAEVLKMKRGFDRDKDRKDIESIEKHLAARGDEKSRS